MSEQQKQIGAKDRSSPVYQQAVAAFHAAWDEVTQQMRRQVHAGEPIGDLGARAAMPWPLPELGAAPFEIAVYVGPKRDGAEEGRR